METPLSIATMTYLQLKERLSGSYPQADDETLLDTLEGITDLHEMIAAVIRSALVDEALQAGLRGRLHDMKERLSRLEVRASKKRQLSLEAMTEAGLNQARAARLYRLSPSRFSRSRSHRRGDDPGSLLAAAAAEARSPGDPRRAQARHRHPRGADEQPQASA